MPELFDNTIDQVSSERPSIKSIRMPPNKVFDGIFAINKPVGISSATVIRHLKQLMLSSKKSAWFMKSSQDRTTEVKRKNLIKIGFGGTLDPLASGVIVIGLGSGTKKLQNYLSCTKEYKTVCLFGTATDTYDSEGKIIKRSKTSFINEDFVIKALEQFNGSQVRQIPPIYSALRMDGMRLYEYARLSKALPRPIVERQHSCTCSLLNFSRDHTYIHPASIGTIQALISEEIIRGNSSIELKIFGDVEKRDNTRKADFDEPDPKRLKMDAISEDKVSDDGILSRKKDENETKPSNGVSDSYDDKVKNPEMKRPNLEESLLRDENALFKEEQLGSFDEPLFPIAEVKLTVSSGFYVRSFVHDLGRALNSSAHVARLERTRQGQFDIEQGNVLSWDWFQDKGKEGWEDAILEAINEAKSSS